MANRRLAKLILVLLQVLALAAGPAAESPGRFAFHSFPPAQGQGLGTASRPVANGRGGFWFLNEGAIWVFDASGYRALGAADGIPAGGVDQAHPEPSSGMWFHAGASWCHLGRRGLRTLPELPAPADNLSFLAVRNEGFAVVAGDRLRIYGPDGGAPVVLPSPGPGAWVKGWKDPRSGERRPGPNWRLKAPCRGEPSFRRRKATGPDLAPQSSASGAGSGKNSKPWDEEAALHALASRNGEAERPPRFPWRPKGP